MDSLAEPDCQCFHMSEQTQFPPEEPDRRGFFTRVAAGAIGAFVGLFPALAGLRVYFDPLGRKSSGGDKVKVATLDSLVDGGAPRRFAVLSDKTDAWTTQKNTPIGSVYLRRIGERVEALNASCPHAGCSVAFKAKHTTKDGEQKENVFSCPCHDSLFAADGEFDSGVSPRGLDTLEVEVTDKGEVLVKFQNFQAGHAHKTPI